MDINQIIQKIMSLPYVPSLLSWMAFGLSAGVAAKIVLPGQENLGWLRTITIGILGAFLGGIIAAYLGWPVKLGWNFLGFIAAVIGSILLLLINRVVTRS